MCAGRVSSGIYPWMTMRSKQWYTKASRLANSLVKVSIGPLLDAFCLDNKIIGQGTGGNPARDVGGERLPRTESLAEGAPVDTDDLSDHGHLSAGGTLRTDQSTPARVLVHPGQSGGGMRTQRRCRVRPLLLHRYGISKRTRISPVAGQRSEAGQTQGPRGVGPARHRGETHADRAHPEAER